MTCRAVVALGILLALAVGACKPQPADSPAAEAHLGQRTKTADCRYAGGGKLPDPACTPGAVFPDVTTRQLCQPGYARSVRNVPSDDKADVYAEYGVRSHKAGQYEVDHLISLELGGSNDVANLWPEAAEPRPGFHEKDQVENYLHEQVCSGALSLGQAQEQIATNWLQVYDSMPARSKGRSAPLTPIR